MYYLLDDDDIYFPPVEEADEDGLLAVGGDLSVPRLISAYTQGIFPWYSRFSPILWWSPPERMVLFPDKFHCSKSLKRTIKSGKFNVRFDTAFADVIHACAKTKRKERGTWLTSEMIEAYIQLHEHGFAHSVETYNKHGKLVGGLYGVSVGKVFCGESMFHIETDASKVAFYYLVEKLKELGFTLIDAQQDTRHLRSLGAELISREEYLNILTNSMQQGLKIW